MPKTRTDIAGNEPIFQDRREPLLQITYIPSAIRVRGDVRQDKKASQVLETTRECVPEAPHGFWSACFVTRAQPKVLQPDWLSVSSGNVGLCVCVRGARLLRCWRLLLPPSRSRCHEMCVPAEICNNTTRERARPQLRSPLATPYGISEVSKFKITPTKTENVHFFYRNKTSLNLTLVNLCEW